MDIKPDSMKNILSSLTKKIGLDKKMKETIFFGSWVEIVGFRFKKNTKALMIRNKSGANTLVVAVKSSAVAQDLFLFKKDLLEKAKFYSNPLGIKIDDIYFDAKLWESEKKREKEELKKEKKWREPSFEEIERIQIPQTLLEEIEESLYLANFADNSLKERMKKTMIDDIKSQIWKRENNYPTCQKCGITLNQFDVETSNLCPSCKYGELK